MGRSGRKLSFRGGHNLGVLGADGGGAGLLEDGAGQRRYQGWADLGTLVARLRE
jgi:hypothetical protein